RAMALDKSGAHHQFALGLIAAIEARLAGGDQNGAVAPAVDERRVALVIGNGSYQSVTQLENPLNDAETVAAALQATGFDVVTVARDVDRGGFVAALQAFAD